MTDGFLIASAACFVFSLVSFLNGSYHVDRYMQLIALTHQQAPLSRATLKIGTYLFVVPAVLMFFAMKLLQIHLVLIGKQTATTGIAQELVAQTGGLTMFAVFLGILLCIYAQVLIRFGLAKKALLYIPAIILFCVLMIILTQTLVLSLLVANVLTLGLIIVTYRKLRTAAANSAAATQPH